MKIDYRGSLSLEYFALKEILNAIKTNTDASNLYHFSPCDVDAIELLKPKARSVVETTEQAESLLKKLEDEGLIKVDIGDNGKQKVWLTKKGKKAEEGYVFIDLELDPETESYVNSFADREGLTFDEAVGRLLRAGIEVVKDYRTLIGKRWTTEQFFGDD